MTRARKPHIPRYCEICGAPIPPNPGYPAKVCSEACRRTRNSQREQERYRRVKDTPAWQATRAAYLERLRLRAAANPAMAEQLRAAHLAAVQRYRDRLAQDPQKLEAYRAKRRRWWANITPEQRARHREANHAWYASLTREEKFLYYYDARRQRALEQLRALGAKLDEINDDD